MSIRPEKRVWDKTWGQDSKKVQISHTDKMIFNYLIKEINPKDSDIIEMGCGRGVLSYMISKYNPNTITLMDFSKEALERAKNLFQDIQNVHYMDGDLLNIKTDKKYDIVFSSGVVEHFSSKLRKKAIENHFEVSRDKVAIIVPAKPHYNTIRHKKIRTIQSFGWQEAFSKSELNEYCKQHKDFHVIISKRFFSMYGITLFELLSIDSENTIIDIYNKVIKIINKIFFKLQIYRIINFLLKPIEDKFGGLLLVIAEKRIIPPND